MKKIITLAAVVALTSAAMAQTTVTWTGAGDGSNYVDGVNWGGTAPTDDTSTDIAQLTGGTVILDTARQVSGLDFDSGSTLTGAGSIEIGTSGIEVNANSYLTTAGIVLNQADTTVTLDGGRLSFGSGTTVSGTGALTVTGGNTLYMDGGANTYEGGTTITGGARVSVKNGGALGTGTLTLDNGTFSRNNANYNFGNDVVVNSGGGTINIDGWINGAISGSGDLTIIGQGNERGIQAGNTLTGNITLDNTFLRTGGSDAYGTGTITMKNGAVIKNNNNSFNLNNNIVLAEDGGQFEIGWGRWMALEGAISGDGSLTVRPDSGTLYLKNTTNSFSGGLRIEGKVGAKGGDAVGTGDITFAGGTLVTDGATINLGTRGITLESGGGSIQVYNNRNVSHAGLIEGSGKLTVDNDGGALRLAGANTYTGGTEIQGKVWAESGALGTGDITLNNVAGTDRGHLQNYNNGDDTLDNNIIIDDTNGGRLQAGWNANFILNGVLSGSGDLTIAADSGTVVLNGDSTLTYTGSITVESGAKLGGSGLLGGDLSIADGGKLALSSTLTVAGAVNLLSTFGVDDVDGLSSSTAEGFYPLIANGGDFSHIENFGYDNRHDLGGGKEAYFEHGSLQLVVIPEPATLGMVAALGGAILFIRRRFKI